MAHFSDAEAKQKLQKEMHTHHLCPHAICLSGLTFATFENHFEWQWVSLRN